MTKHETYFAASSAVGIEFVPFVLTTYGTLDVEASCFLQDITRVAVNMGRGPQDINPAAAFHQLLHQFECAISVATFASIADSVTGSTMPLHRISFQMLHRVTITYKSIIMTLTSQQDCYLYPEISSDINTRRPS